VSRKALIRTALSNDRKLLNKSVHAEGAVGPDGICDNCRKKKAVQRFGDKTARTEIPGSVHDALSLSGQRLPSKAREEMEAKFGRDSTVQVHTDAQSAKSASDIHAAAYTSGNHIVFASNRFAPDTFAGKQLLSHELAQVIQQSETPNPIPTGLDRGPSDPNESLPKQWLSKFPCQASAPIRTTQ